MIRCCCRAWLLSLLVLLLGGLAQAAPTEAGIISTYQTLMAKVQLSRIQADIQAVSSFGPSRISGTRAEAQTLDYAESVLRSLGATNIRRRPFEVTIPDPESKGSLSVGGRVLTVHPLWPNLVRTSTCDLSGPLLYAGRGSLEEMSGKDVEGRIVLMEFDSGSRWRNAAKFGAKAIIFIEPEQMPRGEAEAKFSSVPVDVPRFFLPLRSAGRVLSAAQRGETVQLTCRQDWVVRKTANLYADFAGTDASQKSKPIALTGYADTMSVVPGLAPGAEGASTVAVLLESARVWQQTPHRRPLQVVLTSGHGLSLRGAREYVESMLKKDEKAPFLTVSLDISSGSPIIGSYGQGWYYEYRNDTKVHMDQMSRLLRAHAERLAKARRLPLPRLVLVDGTTGSDNRSWKNNIPGKFALDCEPMVSAGLNALNFRTIEDSRDSVDTPLDTVENLRVTNVYRQAQTAVAMFHHLLNDTDDRGEPSDHRVPLEPREPQRMSLVGGFTALYGQVVIYDPQRSFIPDIRVPNSLATVLGNQKTMMGVRGDMIQATAGKDATYRFTGVPPLSIYNWWERKEVRTAAFRIDPVSGKIDHAPTLNTPGFEAFATEFEMTVAERESPVVVFPCVPISLFDLVDPQDLRAMIRVRVMDAITGSFPRNFGIFSPGYDQRLNPEIEDVQVLFLDKGQKFMLLGGSMGENTRLVLTNSSVGDEKGKGYVAPGGVAKDPRSGLALNGRFPDIPLNAARDLTSINETRLQKFKKYRIISDGITKLHDQAKEAIKLAEEALARKDWADADRQARAAWGFALRAHPVIMTTANDVVNGVVFYLFLLIPFSYFLERLAVGNSLLTKQLGVSISIFIGSFLILRLIHPAFEIVTNPSMIFIAFVMGALSLIVISFILGKFESSMRAVKAERTGLKEVDMRRGSVALAAFNLGVSNMRRRKARTFLTTLTLVVMTFIVLSFTSIVNELRLDETPSENKATYGGILMRNPGLDPMQLATYRQIANEFGKNGTVARRAYYYGADIQDVGILSLQRADNLAEVRAMLGLDPQETKILPVESALLKGGRWFRPGERNVMILPQPLAEQLKITPREVGAAKVTFAGEDYTVVGIVDPAILRSFTDLDGDGVMPADFSLSRQYQEQKATSNSAFRTFIRLDPANVFIVPTETAMGLGADLRTMAISFPNPDMTRTALESLMPRLRLNLYAGVPEKQGAKDLVVKQFSVQQASKSGGLLLILVQISIAAVFVLNTMVASVYERTKEIGIFSSIGLAPNHIAMLFFAESLVYGILGAVIGYVVAQGSAKIIVATNSLQGLVLNFSSTSAVLSAGLVMATVLGSTIYPARRAAQIAAPAMNEEVFETDPEGDVWTLPLPFSVSATEAGPLSAYLSEWFRAYAGYTIGDFVTAENDLGVWREGGSPEVTYEVRAVTWLAPYDLGISQRLELKLAPSLVPGVYQLDLRLTRQAGDPENWPVVNKRFLAAIRRQFLTWRTLTRDDRAKYVELAEAALRRSEATA